MDLSNLHLTFETVTAGVTVAGLGLASIVKIRNFKKSVEAKLNALLVLPDKAKSLDTRMDDIQKQLTPNGGSSLADKISITSNNVLATRNELKELRDYTAAVARKQQAALHLNSGCLIEFDARGMCAFANRAFLRLLGRSELELLGTGWLSCIQAEDRHAVLSMWEDAVESRSSYETQVRFLPTGGGATITALLNCTPVSVAEQGVVAWLGSVTVQKQ